MDLKVDRLMVVRWGDVERLAKTLYVSPTHATFRFIDGKETTIAAELLPIFVRKVQFLDLLLLFRNEMGSGYEPPIITPPVDPVDPTDPTPETPPDPPAEPEAEEEPPPEDQLEDSFPAPDGTEEEPPIPDESQLENTFPTPPTDEQGGPWPDTTNVPPSTQAVPSDPSPPSDMTKAAAFALDSGDTDTITPSQGLWNVVRPRFNALFSTEQRIISELWFRYRGDPATLVPLTDSTVPIRIGMILRQADPCNLVALWWDITPNDGIKVAVKTNAGLNTFAACGDGGFTFVNPTFSVVPGLPQVDNILHRLRWELAGTVLTVKVDDFTVWVGTLPSAAFDIVGPIGVTSNNAKFDFTLWVPLPDNTPPPVRKPSAPLNFAPTLVDDGVVAFGWDPPADLGTSPLDSGVIEVFNATTGIFVSRTIFGWGLTKQVAHINGIAYRARIAAISAAGTGTFSPLSTPYTPTQRLRAPTAPQNVRVVLVGDQTAAFAWDAPADTGTNTPASRIIEVYDDSGALLLSSNDVWSLNAQLAGLTNKVMQHIRVAAVSAAGQSPFSDFSPFFTPDVPAAVRPDAPINPTVEINDTVAALKWSAGASDGGAPLTQFLVQVFNADTNAQVATLFGDWAEGVSMTLPDIPVQVPLIFKVAAANLAGTSQLSAPSAQFSTHWPIVTLAFHPPWDDLTQHTDGRLGITTEPGWTEGHAIVHTVNPGDGVGSVLIASGADKVLQEGDVLRLHVNMQFLAALWPSGGINQKILAFCNDAAGGTQPLRILATPTAGWAVQGFAGTNLHTAQPTDARQWDLQLEICFSVNPSVGYVSLYDNGGGVYILNKTAQQTMSGAQAILRAGLPSFGGSVQQGWLHSAIYGDLLRVGQTKWRRIFFDGMADTVRVHKANQAGSSSYANQVANSALDRAYLVKDGGLVWVRHTVKSGDKAGPTTGPGGQLSETSMVLNTSQLRRQLIKGDEVTFLSRFKFPTGFTFVNDGAQPDTSDPVAVLWRLQQRAVAGQSPPFEIVLNNNLLRARIDGKYWDDLGNAAGGFYTIAQPAQINFVYNVKLIVRFDDDPQIGRAELYINDQLVAARRYMRTILPIASPPYNVDSNGNTITEEMDSVVCGMDEAPNDDPVSGISITRSIFHGGGSFALSRNPAALPAMAALPPPAATPDPVTGPPGMTQATALTFDSGGATSYQIITGLWRAEDPVYRASYSSEVRSSAELWFTHLGDSNTIVPLADGTIRKQIGMMARVPNPCNVLYIMWHLAPDNVVEVSFKSNPGQTTSAQCGDAGYTFLTPTTNVTPPPFNDGKQHKLGWAIVGTTLSVYCDGVLSWQGTVPTAAINLVGPVGIRADNCKFNFNLWIPAPDAGPGGEITPQGQYPHWTLQDMADFDNRYAFNGDWDEWDLSPGERLVYSYDGSLAPTVIYEHLVDTGYLNSRAKVTEPSKSVLRAEPMTLTGKMSFGCPSPSVPWTPGVGNFGKVFEFRDQNGALVLSVEADTNTGRLVDSSGAVLGSWTLTKNTMQAYSLSWNTAGATFVIGSTTVISNKAFVSNDNPLYLRSGAFFNTAVAANQQFRRANTTMAIVRNGKTIKWQFDSYANGTNVGGKLADGSANSGTRTYPSIVQNGFQDRIQMLKVLNEWWHNHYVKSTDLNNGSGPRSEFKMSTAGTQFLKGSSYRSYHEFMLPSNFPFSTTKQFIVLSKQDHQVGSGNTTTGSSPPLEFDLVNRDLVLRLGGNPYDLSLQKTYMVIPNIQTLTKYTIECEFYMHDSVTEGHAIVKVNGVEVVNGLGRTMMPVTDVSPEINYCKTGLYKNSALPDGSLYVRRHVVMPVVRKTVILKLDDLSAFPARLDAFQFAFDTIQAKGVKAGFGFLGVSINDLVARKNALIAAVANWVATGKIEIWGHGFDHQDYGGGVLEFKGRPYAEQLQHIQDTVNACQSMFGLTMKSWGAPFNDNDTNMITALEQVPQIKTLLYPTITTVPGTKRKLLFADYGVIVEPSAGVINYNQFVTNWNAKKAWKNKLIVQFHPGGWDAASKTAFGQVIDFLKGQGVVWQLPAEG